MCNIKATRHSSSALKWTWMLYALMVRENYTTNSCCCFIFNFMRCSVLGAQCSMCMTLCKYKQPFTKTLIVIREIFRSVIKRPNFACRPILCVHGVRCTVYGGALFWFSWKVRTERLVPEMKPLPNEIVSYYYSMCNFFCFCFFVVVLLYVASLFVNVPD